MLIPYLCLGLPGGALFEHYILTRGKTSHAQLLERALHNSVPLTPEDCELFQEHYSLLFWFDSIRHMHQLNQKCARPLAIWTMLQEYRGLSRIGRHINSSVDIALPIRAMIDTKADGEGILGSSGHQFQTWRLYSGERQL